MDPVLMSVAGLGASVLKFLLHTEGNDTAAGLVADAQEGLGLLAGLRERVNDRGGAVAKCIEKTVADRVRGMYQKCRDRGVGAEDLDGVATEVVRLVDRVAADNSLILEAVRFPDKFADLLHDLGDPIRATLFERSEPYFNELVDAVAGEYVRLAPGSPKLQIEALKYVIGGFDRTGSWTCCWPDRIRRRQLMRGRVGCCSAGVLMWLRVSLSAGSRGGCVVS